MCKELVCKELVDNALDACDAAGRPGQATIEKHGNDTYVVLIAAMASTATSPGCSPSTVRWSAQSTSASRSAVHLATGCALSAATSSRLRPRRIGPTEIVEVSSVPDEIGTTLVVILGPAIPRDDIDDLTLALAAIDFAAAAPPAYTRQPSTHWQDLDPFTEALMLIERDTATVRQIIEQFDGCTGAKAGRLAAPFGKNRLARSMSDAEAPALLKSM